MYMVKISPKSDNVATSYTRLEMVKIAASRYLQPITIRNVKIRTLFRCLFVSVPINSSLIHDINLQNLLFTFSIKELQKVIFTFLFAIPTCCNFFIKSAHHPVN